MENIGAMLEGEWSSLSGMYTAEEADFMAQLLGDCSMMNELDAISSLGVVAPSNFMNTALFDEGLYHSFVDINSNLSCFSQVSNYSGRSSISSHENYYFLSDSNQILATNDRSMSMDFCIGDEKHSSSSAEVFTDGLMEGDHCLNNQEVSDGNVKESNSCGLPDQAALPDKNLQLIEESEMMQVQEPASEERNNNPSENSKKRSRNSGDVQKSKRNVKSKKNQKLVTTSNDNEDSNGRLNGQSSSSCCSEDDSNASQELNEGENSKGPSALNLNGKTRANRGSATDPQSLYARKRRERINERLRILQNLVPNGTKVDISTMLEEAVQYVKFLQLQIKLLSSDDLWMYAPIAYNGMDIGLDLKVGKLR